MNQPDAVTLPFKFGQEPFVVGVAMKFLRVKEIQEMTTLSRSTIWRLEREGKFPKESEVQRRMRDQLKTVPLQPHDAQSNAA